MRVRVVTFLLLALSSISLTQSPPTNETEEVAIRRAKNVIVSTLDNGLPKVSLDFFLRYEAAGAPVRWEVNDCGEQSGDPAIDRGRDFPVCVEADFDAKGGLSVAVVVAVGTGKKGLSGTPELFSVTLSDSQGEPRAVRQLGDLPKELHRPVPKSPRDLGIGVG